MATDPAHPWNESVGPGGGSCNGGHGQGDCHQRRAAASAAAANDGSQSVRQSVEAAAAEAADAFL